MPISKSILFLFAFAVSLSFFSCSDDPAPAIPVESQTIENLAADPATGYDPNTGQPTGTTGNFKLFSFETGDVVSNADSATTKWDIGFRGTTIIVNGGTSGPGTAQAQVVTGLFNEISEAPESDYASDNKPTYAIPTGSGNGWYTASTGAPPTIITPIAGRVIIIKTTAGRYAKMEILSYYKDAPASPTGNEPARYYKFRYVYQPNDVRSFN